MLRRKAVSGCLTPRSLGRRIVRCRCIGQCRTACRQLIPQKQDDEPLRNRCPGSPLAPLGVVPQMRTLIQPRRELTNRHARRVGRRPPSDVRFLPLYSRLTCHKDFSCIYGSSMFLSVHRNVHHDSRTNQASSQSEPQSPSPPVGAQAHRGRSRHLALDGHDGRQDAHSVSGTAGAHRSGADRERAAAGGVDEWQDQTQQRPGREPTRPERLTNTRSLVGGPL
jgi:hypothetical protein